MYLKFKICSTCKSFYRDVYFNDLLKNVTKPKRTKKAAILIYLRTILDWLGMESRPAVSQNIVANKYELPLQVASHLIRSFSIVAKHGR